MPEITETTEDSFSVDEELDKQQEFDDRETESDEDEDEPKSVKSETVSKSKFGNKKTAGLDARGRPILFDSKREATVWAQRLALQKAGVIHDLKRQIPIELIKKFTDVTGTKWQAMKYKADFTYVLTKSGKRVIEDVKGYVTDVYRIKRKLILSKIAHKEIPYDEFIETK